MGVFYFLRSVTLPRMAPDKSKQFCKPMAAIWAAILGALLVISTGDTVDGVEEKACPLTWSLEVSRPKLNVTYLNDDANVFFTVLLPALDCQSDSLQRRDTAIYLNAVSYALELLNSPPPLQEDTGNSPAKPYLPLLHRLPANSRQLKYGAKLVAFARPATNIPAAVNLVCICPESMFAISPPYRCIVLFDRRVRPATAETPFTILLY